MKKCMAVRDRKRIAEDAEVNDVTVAVEKIEKSRNKTCDWDE